LTEQEKRYNKILQNSMLKDSVNSPGRERKSMSRLDALQAIIKSKDADIKNLQAKVKEGHKESEKLKAATQAK